MAFLAVLTMAPVNLSSVSLRTTFFVAVRLCWRAVAFSAWRAPALLNQPIPQPEFWKVNNG